MLISRDGSRNIDVEGSTRDNHTYNGVQKRKDYDGKKSYHGRVGHRQRLCAIKP